MTYEDNNIAPSEQIPLLPIVRCIESGGPRRNPHMFLFARDFSPKDSSYKEKLDAPISRYVDSPTTRILYC